MSKSEETHLPYDMGNAGDLLKHGVLAETLRHRLIFRRNQPIRFLDLFGGEPFSSEISDETVERVGKLSECALRDGQPDIRAGRYYGTGMLAQKRRDNFGGHVSVSLLTATKVAAKGFERPTCGCLRTYFLSAESQPATTHIELWT